MNIYKVNYLTHENTLNNIHVFYGNHTLDLNDLFKRNPTSTEFTNIFNEEELANIQSNNIAVHFSQQSIHIDDTIGVIKSKIMHDFNNTFSFEEIYLFCNKEREKLNQGNYINV